MKKTIKMAVIGALLAAGVSRASAQSNVWDQPVTFSFGPEAELIALQLK